MGAIRTAAAGFLVLIAAAASAADCVTAVRTLSTRASVPNLVAGPSSWTGSSLAVARTQEGVPGAVWVAVYDGSLQTLAEDRLVATDARSIVALAWNGSEHGLFYRTVNDALFLQRLSATGDPIGDRAAVTPGRLVYSGDDIDAVWSPALNAWVVGRVVSQGLTKGLWLTLLEKNGAQRSDRQAPVSVPAQPALTLAVTDTGVIGAFFNNAAGSLALARATGEGVIEVRSLAQRADFIAATAHNGLFVVAYDAELDSGAKSEIRWFVVDTAQRIVRADARLVAPRGDDVWPLSLISNGEELALAYIDAPRRSQPIDQSYRLRRFTFNGTVISDTPFAAESAAFTRAQTPFRFAWTGTSYVSAAVHSASDRLNSYLLRYCPLVAEIVSPTRIVRLNTPVIFSAAASGGVPAYQYAWTFPFDLAAQKGPVQERVFDRTGTYTVLLEVTDFAGAVVRDTITVEVVKPKVRAVRP